MKKLHRIIIAVLVCSLFLGYACLPVKVEASATAAVVIGVGGASATVAPYIALGAVLLIAGGYVVRSLDKLISDTQEWINSVPGMLAFLLKSTADSLYDIGILQLPETIRIAVEDKLKENGFAATLVNCLYVPNDFTSMSSLSKEELLGLNVVEVIQEGNLIQQYTKNLISNITGTISDTYSFLSNTLANSISHITDSLTAIRTQIVSAVGNVETVISTFRTQFIEKIGDVQTVLSTFRTQFVDNISSLKSYVGTKFTDLQFVLSTFRTQFVEKIGDVNTHLCVIRENTLAYINSISGFIDIKMSDVKTVLSTFRTQFVDKISDVRTAIGNVLTLVKNSVVTGIQDVQTAVIDLTNSITSGISVAVSNTFNFDSDNEDNKDIGVDGGLAWFGHSYDLLGEYGVGLLAAGAVLKEFTDMDFFSSLIIISLSIGLVSVFFGIFMNVAQADSSKSSKHNHSSGSRAKNGG